MIGMRNVSASVDRPDCEIAFVSDEGSVQLRHDEGWWAVDTVNDRGQHFDDVAQLSNYELVEKFLMWRWASLVRTATGAKQRGAELHAQGPSSGVEFVELPRDHFVELRLHDDRARVSSTSATVFSHVMRMSVEDIERDLAADIGQKP